MLKLLLLLIAFNLQAREINWESYIKESPKYRQTINKAAKLYRLQPLIIDAIICVETDKWNPYAIGIGGQGLMGIKQGSLNPHKSIIDGASILRYHIDNFKADTSKADTVNDYLIGLTAYNLGNYGAVRHGEVNEYARLVFRFWTDLLTFFSNKNIKIEGTK
jgi:soluble lytic murein transglycosylase-like protein